MKTRYLFILSCLSILTYNEVVAEPATDPYANLNQLYVNQNHPIAADVPGNGSEDEPWATIDYPINQNLLRAGDVLNIVNSSNTGVETYYLTTASPNDPQIPTLRIRSSGTVSHPIVIRAKWGQYRMVRVDGPGLVFGTHYEYENAQENIVFAGLIIHSTGSGGSVAAQAMAGPFSFGGGYKGGIVVEYCELIGAGTYNINDNAQLAWIRDAGTQANPIIFRHNLFRDHTKIGDDPHGGAAIRGYRTSTAHIYNNLFTDLSVGVDFKSGAGIGSYVAKNIFQRIKKKAVGLSHAGGGNSTVNLDIFQNVYIGPPENSTAPYNSPFVFLNMDTGTLNNLKVYNNTLYEVYHVFFTSQTRGLLPRSIEYFNNVRIRDPRSSLDAKIDTKGLKFSSLVAFADNNCNWNPTTWQAHPGGWAGFDANSVVGDPKFIDLANNQFGLQESSPCRNAGIDRAQLLGGSASASINMGAFITTNNTDEIGPDWIDHFVSDNTETGQAPLGLSAVESVASDIEFLLPTGNSSDDKRIQKALGKLSDASDIDNWVDLERVNHENAFRKLKDAIKELMEVESIDVLENMQALMDVAAAAARIAIEDAQLSGGDPKKIGEAWKKMGKAEVKADDGKYSDAIEQYKRAWKKAGDAV